MKLRKLKLDDAPYMKEWMKDKFVISEMCKNYDKITDNEIIDFIVSSWNDPNNINLAIVSDEDEYMGTVSLKNIEDGNAEFAITVRKKAMGHGYSWIGMQSILNKAFEEMEIESVYWCVKRTNKRAIRFYDKHNFHEAMDIPEKIRDRYANTENLKWYSVLKGDEFNIPDSVAGCRVIHIETIPTIKAGELSFFEASGDKEHIIPFDIKRIYYISKVPEGVRRGFHAHKELKQLLFCPYGKIQIILENKNGREEIELSDPSIGVLIEEPTWREMLWLKKDSVLCVAASEYYDANDYIRNYEDFKTYMINEGR